MSDIAAALDPASWQAARRPSTSTENLYFAEHDGEEWLFFRPNHYTPEAKNWVAGWWVKAERAWRLPKLRLLAERAQAYDGVTVSADVQTWLTESAPKADEDFASEPDAWMALFPRAADLYPFQRNAVYGLLESERGKLNVLNPGLGKTVVSIAAAEILEAQRILVVAPKPLTRNWKREIKEWTGSDQAIVVASKDIAQIPELAKEYRYIVINYEAVSLKHEVITDQHGRGLDVIGPLADVDWDVLIVDETIMLKNRKSKRTRALQGLAHRVDKVWMLSGAPVAKGNEDAWAQLHMLRPNWFTSYWRFAAEYSIVEQGAFAMQILGSRSDRAMRDELPEVMFARTMEEVLPDLPDYIVKTEDVELGPKQAKMHKQILDGMIEEFEGMGDDKVEVPNAIAAITRCAQATSNLANLQTMGYDFGDESAKADALLASLNGESDPVELPMVIWVHFKPGAKALHKRLTDAGYKVGLATGDTDAAKEVEDYKDGKTEILILSLGVGKYGHTLIDTKTFVYHDRTMDSDAMFQSWWRGRRIGLKHRPVMLILRAPNTIDDFIEENLEGKMPAMSGVTGQQLAMMLRNIGR